MLCACVHGVGRSVYRAAGAELKAMSSYTEWHGCANWHIGQTLQPGVPIQEKVHVNSEDLGLFQENGSYSSVREERSVRGLP